MMSARVKLLGSGHSIRSPAPSRSPLLWMSRSRTRISRVIHGSLILNCGRYLTTGSSHWSLPASTRRASRPVVIALVFEAILNSVSASIGLAAAGHELAGGARVGDLAVFDHAQRHAGQVILGHHRIEDGVEGLLVGDRRASAPRARRRATRATGCRSRAARSAPRVKPRRRSPAVTLRVWLASLHPWMPPPPSKSEASPT